MSVTFALLCYNQEKFIREALRGAFRQDYQPLEILISDDHSTDASFDILREEVANYSGPRTVRLVRNGENLGFENFARTAEAASGEFLIRASQWEALSLAGARAPSSAEYGVLSSPSSGGEKERCQAGAELERQSGLLAALTPKEWKAEVAESMKRISAMETTRLWTNWAGGPQSPMRMTS